MATIDIGGPKQRIRRARGAGIQLAALGVALLGTLLFSGTPALAGGDWNEGAVKWRSYEDGLAATERSTDVLQMVKTIMWLPRYESYV